MTARLDAAIVELVSAIRDEVNAEVAHLADSPPKLLSIEQAARRLGIGRTATYSLMGRGELRSVKVGRRRLIPADALAAVANGAGRP